MTRRQFQQVAVDALSYDHCSGVFTRKTRTGGMDAGSVAGVRDALGYIRISIKGRQYYAHRLAWLMHYGEEPPSIIDHANGDRSDNRISNLRAATKSQNNANSRAPRHNTSGIKGVVARPDGRFAAYIKVNRRSSYLGLFETSDEAAAAYKKAAEQAFGSFAKQEKNA